MARCSASGERRAAARPLGAPRLLSESRSLPNREPRSAIGWQLSRVTLTLEHLRNCPSLCLLYARSIGGPESSFLFLVLLSASVLSQVESDYQSLFPRELPYLWRACSYRISIHQSVLAVARESNPSREPGGDSMIRSTRATATNESQYQSSNRHFLSCHSLVLTCVVRYAGIDRYYPLETVKALTIDRDRQLGVLEYSTVFIKRKTKKKKLLFCFRRETIPVHVGGMHVEICPFGRINAALSQAYRTKAVQVPSLSAIVLAERSSVASHEEALTRRIIVVVDATKRWNDYFRLSRILQDDTTSIVHSGPEADLWRIT